MKRLAIFLVAALYAANSCRAVLHESCDLGVVSSGLRFALESALNSDVQQARMLLEQGRELELTESQARSSCKLVQGLTNCTADFIAQCVDTTTVPDLQQIVRGTRKLMEGCDRPGTYAQGVTLVKCGKTVAPIQSVRTCFDTAAYWVETNRSRALNTPNQTLELLRTGHLLEDLCCIFNDLRTCIGPDVRNNCSGEAVELFNSKSDTVLEAYGCAAKTANGCPVRGPRPPRPMREPCQRTPGTMCMNSASYLHSSITLGLSVFILACLLRILV